jgi:hypothetical protein
MPKANRTSWEREGYFDHIYAHGVVTVPRHKYIYLANQWNICPTVDRVWLEHWRDYCDDQHEDLCIVIAGGTVLLWKKKEEEIEPTTLSGD